MQRTFSIIKPDATKRNITGSINKIIEENDLIIVAQKRVKLSKEKAEGFYSIHKEKSFFRLQSFNKDPSFISAIFLYLSE